jgi:lipopolysaccharide heptosyltransferase I
VSTPRRTEDHLTKILLVRLSALGDIVHAVPVAAAIRRAFPHTAIDWLVDVRYREMVDLVSVIDRAISVNPVSARSLSSVVRDLRRSSYDVALDLQGLLKSGMLARLSGAKRVIGFPADLLRERGARVFYSETAGDAGPHIIDKNLSILKAIGVRMAQIEFPLKDPNGRIVLEARSRLGIADGSGFAILNPGAGWPNKRWPPVYFAEVARGLANRHMLKSIVLWGPGEQRLAEAVVEASDGSATLAPRTTVVDLVSLIKAAALMISGDTGPMHIAGAVGTPVVGLFGPTDPKRNGPVSDDDLSASRFNACSCHYQRQCRIAGWCLLDISPREVLELVDRRLVRVG